MAEDTENLQKEKLNAEQQDEENNIPTIDNIDNVPPLDVEMFQQKTMSDLFNKPDNTPEKQWLYQQINDYLQAGSFTEEDAHNLNHPVYNEIYQNYLNDLTYDIKSDVFSLDADKVNSAIEKLQNLACMQFAGNLESAKQFDKVMRIRLSSVPQLEYAFETAVVGRDIFNMINSSSNSVATQIEVENKVQSLEDLHDYNIIDNEQMAFGYHNIAILMEQLSRKKSDRMGNNNEQLASYDYMGKALRLTSNPQLIKTCFEYLPDNMNKKMLFVREACDRALENYQNDSAALYKIHTLYGKSMTKEYVKSFLHTKNCSEYKETVYHYKEAFNYADSKEKKIKALRGLAKLQQHTEPEKAFEVRSVLAEQFLEGKTKVRELMKLSLEAKQPNIKAALLESAANELIDSNTLKAEEKSLLLSNVIHNLRPLYGENKEKLANLQKIEQKYCKKEEKRDFMVGRLSSKGNDYFN